MDGRRRVAERDAEKQVKKVQGSRQTEQARKRLSQTVEALPLSERESVRHAVQQLEAARRTEERVLRDDLQLYRTLASLGTTIAVLPMRQQNRLDKLKRWQKALNEEERRRLVTAIRRPWRNR